MVPICGLLFFFFFFLSIFLSEPLDFFLILPKVCPSHLVSFICFCLMFFFRLLLSPISFFFFLSLPPPTSVLLPPPLFLFYSFSPSSFLSIPCLRFPPPFFASLYPLQESRPVPSPLSLRALPSSISSPLPLTPSSPTPSPPPGFPGAFHMSGRGVGAGGRGVGSGGTMGTRDKALVPRSPCPAFRLAVLEGRLGVGG